MVDFIIEIPKGKKPVILQLSDPQMLDSSQAVKGRLSEGEDTYWAKDKKEERCFKYIRETVKETSPDLILIAGDIVYGEFDHDGSALLSFVEFMDSFDIPWAPVLGNHETESRMGADWQCEQLHNAKNCLFKQRTLTGNGNYTVGIKQDGKLIRVFYMMDSNSGHPSELSIANGHSVHGAGFGDDQIAWYTDSIKEIHRVSPNTRIGFMFHIALHAFENAYEKYGYTRDRSLGVFPLIIDETDGTSTDFGVIMYPIDNWDKDNTVWNGLKELGVDAVLVGHDHEVSASVVYDGVRCQFGLKSSTYDSNIYVNENGKLVKSWVPAGTPMIGGTVMELAPDGEIETAYHYYCKNVSFER
jgi:3',5'-cyclic AMP phosphodiesterase CpdA